MHFFPLAHNKTIYLYRGLQEVTRGYRGLRGVTRGYKGLQRVTGGYKGLQGVTGGYRGKRKIEMDLPKKKKRSPNFGFCACLKKMTIYFIMPELLENMLFLLQHFP